MIAPFDSFISSNDTVLDIGCGIGTPVKGLVCKGLTGIDAVDYSKEYPGKFIVAMLPCLEFVPDKSYDVIICIDCIEHLTKEDGFELLKHFNRIVRKMIYIFTPAEWDSNESSVNDSDCWAYGNHLNLHKSLWTVADFTSNGYDAQEILAHGWVTAFIHAYRRFE